MVPCPNLIHVLRSLANMTAQADKLMLLHDDLAELKAEHGNDACPEKSRLVCITVFCNADDESF